MKKLIVFAIAIFGFTAVSFGQSSATKTASSTATIIFPITLTKTTDLNFGTVIPGATVGTVVLDYSNGRTFTGGATILNSSADQTTAVFDVTGQPAQSFNITIPSSPIIMTGNSTGMTVSDFKADLIENSTSVLSGTGTATIKVKATLNVPINALPGEYTNAAGLSVTVNYN